MKLWLLVGRVSAHDVAAFARECSHTPVKVLTPADFPHTVQLSQQLWFVDFFAPVSVASAVKGCDYSCFIGLTITIHIELME